MTDTPADIGPATAAANAAVNLSPEAAALEIQHLRAGADRHFSEAYFNAGHMGHQAAVDRMTALHALAFPDPADTAAPASATPARGDDGRFAPAAEAIDTTAYRGLTLESMPADTPTADLVKANEEVRTLAATIGIPADTAKAGLRLLERDATAREGRAMDAAELGEFENILQKMVGADYDKAVDKLEATIKGAGKRGELLRRSIASASPHTAAWAVAMMFHEARQ